MKKTLLLTMLLALLLPWAINAEELTVNEGTATSDYVPFYGSYVDTHGTTSEFVISSEVDGMSAMIGATISKLTFYISNSPLSWGSPVLQLYMGEVSGTTISSVSSPSDFTVVASGTWDNTQPAMEIEFTDPYTYNGGNLLIGTYVQSASSTYKSTSFYGVSAPSGTAFYSYSYGAYPLSFAPKVTFEYTGGVGELCERPSAVEVAEVTTNSAEISWADGSGEFNVEYKKVADADWTSLLANTNDLSATLEGLMPNTAYQVRVQSVCEDTVSGWKSASFKTLIGVPFVENFDATTLPAGWTRASALVDNILNGTGTFSSSYSWYFGTGNGVFDSHARLEVYSTSCMHWLITPSILLDENVELTFDMALTKYSGTLTPVDQAQQQDDKFIVLISLDEGASWEILRQWDNQGSEDVYNSIACSAIGQSVSIDLSGFAGENAMIAFYGESTATDGDNYLHIDNVRVDFIPACPKPHDLALEEGGLSSTSAVLTWEAGGDESTWLVQYKKASDSQWISIEDGVTDNPFELTDLQPATSYQVRVAAWCDPDDAEALSEFTKELTFATECEALTIDENNSYVDNFEAYAASTEFTPSVQVLPNCWSAINTTAYSTYKVYPSLSDYSYSSYALSGTKFLKFYMYGSSYYDPQDQYAILPEIDDLSSLRIRLSARKYTDSYDATFIIGVMEDPADVSTFEAVESISPASTSYEEFAVSFANYAGAGRFIAIKVEAPAVGSSTYKTVFIDDVIVEPIPDCDVTRALAVANIGNSSASLSWSEEGGAWEYGFVENPAADFVPADEDFVNQADSNGVILEGLTADADILFFVRRVCASSSGIVSSIAFHTLQNPATVPFSDDFEGNAQWQLVNGNLTNAWVIGSATNNGGSKALYISNDGGATNAYSNSDMAVVYAMKLFHFEADNYIFSYDWRAKGEAGYSIYDYLRVVLVPASVELTPGTTMPSTLSSSYTPSGWIALDGGSALVNQENWQSFVSDEIAVQEGYYYMVFIWRNDGSSGSNPPAAIDNISISTISCSRPSALQVSNIGSHSADLTWTAGGSETAWQIMLSNDADNIIDAVEKPFALEGLAADSLYSVKVRSFCGDGAYSEWSNAISFRTLVSCPAPVFRADSVKNILGTSAEIHWGGDAESYTVSYRTATSATGGLNEGFENGVGSWTLRNCDSSTGISTSKAHSGSKSFRFYYNYAPPQYLISPEMSGTSEGAIISFYYKAESANFVETFKVGYSSTDNATASFTFGSELSTVDTDWHLFSEAVPTGTRFVCIQYTAYNQYYLYIDDILIGDEIPAGEWQVVENVEGNSLLLEGLESETLYDVKVQADCGDEGLSSESSVVSFSTLSTCPTPNGLTLAGVTTSSAEIAWNTMELDEFNLRYSEDGENWTEIANVSTPYTIDNLEAGTAYRVQVQAACNTETWSAALSFKTAYGIPFQPGEITGSILSAEWSIYRILASDVFAGSPLSSTGYWTTASSNTVFAESHPKLNIYGGSRNEWLVSPAIDLSDVQLNAGQKLKLSFTMAYCKFGDPTTEAELNGTDDKFMVAFSTDNGATWSETNATVWSNAEDAENVLNAVPTTGLDVQLDFSTAAGHVLRFAFYGESTVSNADNDMHIGNILLDVVGNTTGIDALENSTDAVKFFKDGHFYILRDGVIYDMIGRKVK